MRKDENGNSCPETLGEYRKLVSAIVGESNKAVEFLDKKIAESPHGENERIIVADHQMRLILFPMMAEQ